MSFIFLTKLILFPKQTKNTEGYKRNTHSLAQNKYVKKKHKKAWRPYYYYYCPEINNIFHQNLNHRNMSKSIKDLKPTVASLDVKAQSQIKGGTNNPPPPPPKIVIDDLSGF